MNLAMDIGASKIALAVGQSGTFGPSTVVRHGDTDDAVSICTRLRAALAKHAPKTGRFDRIAMACAPSLDDGGRITGWPNRPAWVGVDLAALCRPFVSNALLWCDDGVAATIADASVRPQENLLHLVIGTGVGGTVWVGRKAVYNPEFGHWIAVPGGKTCVCGAQGCLQAYVGGRAIDAARRRGKRHDQTEWLTAAVTAISTLIYHVSNRYGVMHVSFSGGFLREVSDLPDRCSAHLSKHSGKTIKVTHSPFGSEAPLAGAKLLVETTAPAEDIRDRLASRVATFANCETR